MSTSHNSALCGWLSRFQRLEMTEEQVDSPARTVTASAHVIGDLADGMAFDTDPATFSRLLHDLAPDEVKSGERK